MAIAFDAATESERTATTDPWTFTHTPVGTPKGVALLADHGGGTTDFIVTVTYGGVALARVQSNTDSSGEQGRSYLYFLGAGIPTGAQTVEIDLTSATTTDIHFVCITMTASTDTALVDSDGVNEDVANPSVTLQYAGRTCFAVAILWGGLPNVGDYTAGASCTMVHQMDFGNAVSSCVRQTTPGTSDFAISVSGAIDDVGFSAAAFSEAVPSTLRGHLLLLGAGA